MILESVYPIVTQSDTKNIELEKFFILSFQNLEFGSTFMTEERIVCLRLNTKDAPVQWCFRHCCFLLAHCYITGGGPFYRATHIRAR